jgi:hypothetical protein
MASTTPNGMHPVRNRRSIRARGGGVGGTGSGACDPFKTTPDQLVLTFVDRANAGVAIKATAAQKTNAGA